MTQEPQGLIPAAKMNGLGNQILIADLRHAASGAKLTPALVRRLAAQPAAAFDQLMALFPPARADSPLGAAFTVEIWNRDGTQAEACGNGTRCLASYLWREAASPQKLAFATKGGLVAAAKQASGLIQVDMGKPDFAPHSLPMTLEPADMRHVPLADLLPAQAAAFRRFPQFASALSLGNPHIVFFLPQGESPAALPLAEFGAALERSPVFPRGVNVSLAQIAAADSITLRVWERGAGLTLACGTAACATAIAAHRLGRTNAEVTVSLPGGRLGISYDGGICRMSGPADYEYGGMIELQTGEFRRAEKPL